MASTYNTEPPPTASCTIHTSAGPITFSLFVQQAPLACRNFLQHILDGYYDDTIFHRVVPGFVIQGGDPTNTGEGGTSIYEDAEFEIDAATGEKVVFGDEIHSRLRFNRRGLLGMAKTESGTGHNYGSQFFITLGDCRAELDGKCTMFGRVEGEGIYNVVRIAEGELVEGTERPVWPVKITRAEVGELPKGEKWEGLKRREKVAVKSTGEDKVASKKKTGKKKGGKTLLSFGGDEGEDEGPVVIKKAKFNTNLIAHEEDNAKSSKEQPNGISAKADRSSTKSTRKRLSASPSPPRAAVETTTTSTNKLPQHHRKPSLHDPTTQLPIRDPEQSPSPTPSPPPSKTSKTLSDTNAAIAALKASMRRDVAPASEPKKKKSALEQLIPETSIRGRKRRHDGTNAPNNHSGTPMTAEEADAMKMFNAFKARLEGAAADTTNIKSSSSAKSNNPAKVNSPSSGTRKPTANNNNDAEQEHEAAEEEQLCDLHFIANCQSCTSWHDDHNHNDGPEHPSGRGPTTATADADDTSWMTHALSFEKDRLGKDLTWKKKGEDELVVIDPREREREMGIGRGKGKGRDKGAGVREWDRRR